MVAWHSGGPDGFFRSLLDVNLAARVIESAKRSDEVSKSTVKEAVESGTEVPGVHLVTDGVKLKRG